MKTNPERAQTRITILHSPKKMGCRNTPLSPKQINQNKRLAVVRSKVEQVFVFLKQVLQYEHVGITTWLGIGFISYFQQLLTTYAG